MTDLQTEKLILEEEVSKYKEQMNVIANKLNAANTDLKRVKAELKRIKNDNIKLPITDHAILRFMERVLLLDFDDFKKQILPEDVKKKICTRYYGADGTYPVNDTHKVVIKNKKVVTVLDKKM